MSLFKRRITEPVVEPGLNGPLRGAVRIVEIEYGDGVVLYEVESRGVYTGTWFHESRHATMDEAVKAKRNLEGEILARTVASRRVVG